MKLDKTSNHPVVYCRFGTGILKSRSDTCNSDINTREQATFLIFVWEAMKVTAERREKFESKSQRNFARAYDCKIDCPPQMRMRN